MKFIIDWDAGWGKSYEVIEADDIDSASKIAYEAWLEEAESNSAYGAREFDEKLYEDLVENGDL